MADESHGDQLQNNNTSIDRRANIFVTNNILKLIGIYDMPFESGRTLTILKVRGRP